MTPFTPATPILRSAIKSRRGPATSRRPARREDQGFFAGLTGWHELVDYLPEGAADWGNKVLSEADFSAPLQY